MSGKEEAYAVAEGRIDVKVDCVWVTIGSRTHRRAVLVVTGVRFRVWLFRLSVGDAEAAAGMEHAVVVKS